MILGIDARTLNSHTGIATVLKNFLLYLKNYENPFERVYLFCDEAPRLKYRCDDFSFIILPRGKLKFFFRLRQKLVSCGITHFYSPFYKTACFSKKIKKIITVHDIGFLTYSLKDYTRSGFYRLLARAYLYLSAKRADKIICVSKFTQNEFNAYFKDEFKGKTKVRYSGYNDDIFNLNCDFPSETLNRFQLQKPFILYTGNFTPHKNTQVLLQAAEKLPQKNFVFVTEKKGINLKNVKILSNLKEEELKTLYSACEYFIWPSKYEGFGLPPVEALASGAAVLAYENNAATKEILKDNCLYFKNEDELVNLILSGYRLRPGPDAVSGYSYKITAREILRLLTGK